MKIRYIKLFENELDLYMNEDVLFKASTVGDKYIIGVKRINNIYEKKEFDNQRLRASNSGYTLEEVITATIADIWGANFIDNIKFRKVDIDKLKIMEKFNLLLEQYQKLKLEFPTVTKTMLFNSIHTLLIRNTNLNSIMDIIKNKLLIK